MEILCVYCDVRIEFLYNIWMELILYYVKRVMCQAVVAEVRLQFQASVCEFCSEKIGNEDFSECFIQYALSILTVILLLLGEYVGEIWVPSKVVFCQVLRINVQIFCF